MLGLCWIMRSCFLVKVPLELEVFGDQARMAWGYSCSRGLPVSVREHWSVLFVHSWDTLWFSFFLDVFGTTTFERAWGAMTGSE